MKLALFLLALIPLAYAATIPSEENGIEKRISIDDIINHLKNLDLSDGCVDACKKNVQQFWTFLCTTACRVLFENVTPAR